jgi:hypothetical protein
MPVPPYAESASVPAVYPTPDDSTSTDVDVFDAVAARVESTRRAAPEMRVEIDTGTGTLLELIEDIWPGAGALVCGNVSDDDVVESTVASDTVALTVSARDSSHVGAIDSVMLVRAGMFAVSAPADPSSLPGGVSALLLVADTSVMLNPGEADTTFAMV